MKFDVMSSTYKAVCSALLLRIEDERFRLEESLAEIKTAIESGHFSDHRCWSCLVYEITDSRNDFFTACDALDDLNLSHPLNSRFKEWYDFEVAREYQVYHSLIDLGLLDITTNTLVTDFPYPEVSQ